MTETVQISSNPTFAWTDLLHVLRRQGYRAAFVSGDIESATFRIDGDDAAARRKASSPRWTT